VKSIVNAKLIVDNEIVEGKVLLFDKHISEIVDNTALNHRDDIEKIDAKGNYVSAGFIDLHIHGSGGADIMDATPQALETISSVLLQTGTTSFLATTMTMSKEVIEKALQNIQNHAQSINGAQIVGVHLEGPFINAQKHGAQDKAHVQEPDIKFIESYIDIIKMITLAPEVKGAKDFVTFLKRHYPEVILSIGHSDASYEKSKESFTWGISHATHLFNAMNTLHHRDPGIVGAVLDSDVSCDIIADLVHTHASILKLVHQVKQERLILITDAMRAGCMKCGIYDLGGQQVEVNDGKASLQDGTLAGSVLKLNEALKNMTGVGAMTLVEAVTAVTKIPAENLGLNKGQLKKGYDADIVIFDKDFSIISTIIAGEVKYRRR